MEEIDKISQILKDDGILSYSEFSGILDKSRRKSNKVAKQFKCCVPGCSNHAINSHLLQQHPVLHSICDADNKVYQFCENDVHPMKLDLDLMKLKKLGITQALSMPLFCSYHDSKIFEIAEKDDVDYTDSFIQMLLSYRAFCAIRFEEQKRLLVYKTNEEQNELFKGGVFEAQREISYFFIKRMDISIERLWNNYQNAQFDNYDFRCVVTDKFEVAISDVLLDENDLEENDITIPLRPLFVHLIPLEDKSILILGVDKKYRNKMFDSLFKDNVDFNEIYHKLLVRSRNWCISPSLFSSPQEVEIFQEKYIEDAVDASFNDMLSSD